MTNETKIFRERRSTPTENETLALMRRELSYAIKKLTEQLDTIDKWRICHEEASAPVIEAANQIVALADNLRWLTKTRKVVLMVSGFILGAAAAALIAFVYHLIIRHIG